MAGKGPLLMVGGLGILALLFASSGSSAATPKPQPSPPPPSPPPPRSPPFVPVVNPPSGPPTPVGPSVSQVKIGPGETPVSIAGKFGMSVNDFSKLNPGLTFGVTNNSSPFVNAEFNADGSPTNAGYSPTGMVDALQNIPVFKRDAGPNPFSKLNFFMKLNGVLIPSSNNGPGIGLIFSTGDGHIRFVRPWAVGQSVNVVVSPSVSI